MEPKLADIEWFRPTLEYRNPETVQRIWEQSVVPASWAIKRAYKANNPRFVYPWNCKMCQYGSLCQAELRDHDADFLRKLSTQSVRIMGGNPHRPQLKRSLFFAFRCHISTEVVYKYH